MCVYYPTTHIFLIICVNIVGASKEYQHDHDLNITIMTMKTKWINYFLVAFVFIVIDGLSDYLYIYYENLGL